MEKTAFLAHPAAEGVDFGLVWGGWVGRGGLIGGELSR